MKTELILYDEYELFSDKCEIMPTSYDAAFSLYVDDDNTIEEQLKDEKTIAMAAVKYLNASLAFTGGNIDDDILYHQAKRIMRNPKRVISHIEYVRLAFNSHDILAFIKKNKYLNDKKIVIPEILEITDYDKVLSLIKKYEQYKDHIYVYLDNNSDYVSLMDAYNIIAKIKEISEQIMNLNLSKMETIMYTYDMVRSRIYQEEDKNERYSESRDLKYILNNNKIVCTGYSNLLSAMLNYMGIKCYPVGITNKKTQKGHERNIVYIKDPKYDIDGVYYLDATWDSRVTNSNNYYLNNYLYFAKTRNQMINLENDNYRYDKCPYYSNHMVNDIEPLLKNMDKMDFLKKYFKSLNYMSRVIYGENLFNLSDIISYSPNYGQIDCDEILTKIANIQEKFNSPISAEVYIKLLNNVRKIEYYLNPELFPYDFQKMFSTLINSRWNFENNHYSSEEKMVKHIFGEYPKRQSKYERSDNFVNFAKDNNIDKEIDEVKLTKVLSLYNKSRK